jgi:phage gpG-like protein
MINLASSLAQIIKTHVQGIPVVMQGYIGSEMANRAVSANFRSGAAQAFDESTRRNTGSKLRIASGRLFRSFLPNSLDNIYEVREKTDAITLKFGTKVPYAAIHENGGTITQQRTPRQKAFFWAMFAKTGDTMWKAMALSKKTSATLRIPARPFFAPAVLRVEREYLPKMRDKIVREFDTALTEYVRTLSKEA